MPDQNQPINPIPSFPDIPDIPAAPAADTAPQVPTPQPKKNKGRILATILGIFLLVGAVGAGVILVGQRQLFQQKAGSYSTICSANGVSSDGCLYYDCSQKIDCGTGKIAMGFCNNTYPESDPCGIKTSSDDSHPSSCTAQGYSCTENSQCCDNYCDPNLKRCGAIVPESDKCTGTDSKIPDHTNSACELVNGQSQMCTHYICDWGFSCGLCNGISGNSNNQCPNGYYCVPGGYCIRNGACEYQDRSCVADSSCSTSTTQTPTPTPTATPTLPPGCPTAPQCTGVKAYDTGWNLLTSAQLSALTAGDKVRFAASCTPVTDADKAEFTINTVETEVTTQKPGTGEYYYEYTIPANVTSFTISAKLHSISLGIWF